LAGSAAEHSEKPASSAMQAPLTAPRRKFMRWRLLVRSER
jgi:hypothetical protein